MRKFFRRHRWLSVATVLIGLLAAWRLWTFVALKDRDGNRPQDVAKMFVEAVQVGDFEKAATYWRTGDVRNVEANSEMTFKEFCTKFFKCDTYQISLMGKDKIAYAVAFRGQEGGSPKMFGLFLLRVDGRWRLVMERFMPDAEQGKGC